MASQLLSCPTMTLCSSSKKLGMLLPSRWCLRRVSFWGNYIISLHYSGEQWADRRKQENACRFIFFNKQVFKAFDFEDWKGNLGWSCVYVCFCHTDNPVYFSEHSGPPSGTSSAKQSPATQHRAMGQQPASRDDRYNNHSLYSQHTNVLLSHWKKPQCTAIDYYFLRTMII